MILTRITQAEVPGSHTLFQSGFWASFKESIGTETRCFMISADGIDIPLVALLRVGPARIRYAYVPRGPAICLDEDRRGAFLEELSEALRGFLPDDIACVRYDTDFPSPYVDAEYWTRTSQSKGAPRAEIRELRMNFGTKERNLRKAPVDHLCPDTVLIDLRLSEEQILARMRQTTRNCIRRSMRGGVEYRRQAADWIPRWYSLYSGTARRKGFYCESREYFTELFRRSSEYRGRSPPEFIILSAEKDSVALAGAILGVMGTKGYYLYAGSSESMRECMPNYGLQCEAMRLLRESGCTEYDLMGVPPNGDPGHSMFGLYTFKTGLGGAIAHYCGCWDYPFNHADYSYLVSVETLGGRQ